MVYETDISGSFFSRVIKGEKSTLKILLRHAGIRAFCYSTIHSWYSAKFVESLVSMCRLKEVTGIFRSLSLLTTSTVFMTIDAHTYSLSMPEATCVKVSLYWFIKVMHIVLLILLIWIRYFYSLNIHYVYLSQKFCKLIHLHVRSVLSS